MPSEAQKRANKNYRKKMNRIMLDFSPAEAELWEHIQNQPKKQTYIKDLIRADMGKPRVFGYARVATKEQITEE